MTNFLAGVARCDITPPIGIAHGNWSAQVHERAEGVDLPLTCTALAAADGETQVIIAEWELLYPPDGEWLTQVRQRITELTGVPGTNIRISAAHTHAGPNLKRPWFEAGAEMIAPYVASLTDRLAGVCLAAHRAMRPARVAGSKGFSAMNSNRRLPWAEGKGHFDSHPFARSDDFSHSSEPILMAPNPDGYSDHEVGVIRIDDERGDPIAILVNYAAHPTILSWDNHLLSPDYPGTLRRTVENLTGATCLFLQGAAGNQDTIRDYSCRVEDARWVGRQIGLEVVRVAELIETQPSKMKIAKHVESSWTMGVVERVPVGEADPRVRCLSRKIKLPAWTRPQPSDAERSHLKDLEKHLANLRAHNAPVEEIRKANMDTRRAALDLWSTERRSKGTHIEMEFQAIRLGSTALVGIPVEPFAEIGAEVKAGSPFATTFFSGYTNGVESYMPTAAAYEEGGYEVWMAPFAPQAAGITVAESLKLLRELSA